MATIYDIIEENNRIAKMQADLADFGKPFSEQKLGLSIPKSGNIFTSRFDNFSPSFGPQLTPEQQLQLYLETEGGDVDIEDVNRFQPQNVFQKSLNFFQNNPAARLGLGAILGGPVGALAGFFANKIGDGVSNFINKFKPAPNVPVFTGLGDMDMNRNVTTSSGETVDVGDLVSVTDATGAPTGFQEYSSPEVASRYEGSS
jgi:hypothetical protein|tara:strand:+ start:45 stop:647 length:603 start_codon:yes stop_codon:yes gene_type:complete